MLMRYDIGVGVYETRMNPLAIPLALWPVLQYE